MNTFRTILTVFALVAVFAPGVARADESARPVQVAQAQNGAQPGDNRPATLGDIRHMEARSDAQISELRTDVNAQISELRADMNAQGRELRDQIQQLHMQNQGFHTSLNNALMAIVGIFATMMAAFVALFWKFRAGTPSAPAAVFLIPIALAAALTVGAAVAAVI